MREVVICNPRVNHLLRVGNKTDQGDAEESWRRCCGCKRSSGFIRWQPTCKNYKNWCERMSCWCRRRAARTGAKRLIGGAGEYLKSGDPIPSAAFEAIKSNDAILLGAMRLPNVCWPGGVEMTPQIELRERLDLYCGLRPVRKSHSSSICRRVNMARILTINCAHYSVGCASGACASRAKSFMAKNNHLR